MATVDTVHERLCDLLAEMMGSASGHAAPRPHSSFFALGGTEDQAADVIQIVNALFTLDLPADAIMTSPTPDALARAITSAWSQGDGAPAGLIELINAIADAQ
jgi:hypothetical protein